MTSRRFPVRDQRQRVRDRGSHLAVPGIPKIATLPTFAVARQVSIALRFTVNSIPLAQSIRRGYQPTSSPVLRAPP
jgi:hypothetical protein